MTKKKLTASQIIDTMISKDEFSQWLGISRVEEREGYCKLRMEIRPEMCNGFGIAHGGIAYSFADSALAFASNSHGRHAVSIETSITHLKALHSSEIITATSEEQSFGNRTAVYYIKVENDEGLIALFKGTVFIKDSEWLSE
jgi:acyl-CoA thioesterase